MHIPFCVRKCAYCDFLSGPADDQTKRAYADALVREMRSVKEKYSNYRVDTVFLGGGTPSILEGDETARIFHALSEDFDISLDAEITMEVNPGTVPAEKAETWKACGVNRLSIGLQSADDGELKMLGRIHTFGQFLETWEIIRRAGFDNVNIDLISALPGQTAESWAKTLHTAAELGPEHISAYSLIVEEGTPFYEIYGEPEQGVQARSAAGQGRVLPPLPDEDEERGIYQATKEILDRYGYHRYEISNYAKEGYECRHNLGYWERKEYLGLGLGAASLVRERRFHNTADMEKYMGIFGEAKGGISDPASGEGAAEDFEELTLNDRMEEFIFLGLRKMEGISEQDFRRIFGKEIRQVYKDQIKKLTEQGLLAGAEGRIFLTERGIDISNYVFSEFIF